MPRWQRWTTWSVLGACLVSGAIYLVAMDFVETRPATLAIWWITHGLTGLVALAIVGGAITSHVVATWRASRGRVTGAINLALLATLAASAVALFYGPQAWRDAVVWTHLGTGVAALVAFPAHVWWGRSRRGRASPPADR